MNTKTILDINRILKQGLHSMLLLKNDELRDITIACPLGDHFVDSYGNVKLYYEG